MLWVPFSFQRAFERAFTTCWQVHEKSINGFWTYDKVISLADYRKKLQGYLSDKMGAVAPSLASLIGDVVGARLISHAGSLTKLAKYPASTVQILGAEKALFRALKTRGNTPKYGLLFHSTFIGRATAKNKGKNFKTIVSTTILSVVREGMSRHIHWRLHL